MNPRVVARRLGPRRGCAFGLLGVLAVLGVGAPAEAHPLNGVVPSHALRLTLREGALTADYSLRVPTHEIVQELNALDLDAERRGLTRQDSDAFIATKLDELRDGLVLRADGARVSWTRAPRDAPTGLGNVRHVQFDQLLEAQLPPGVTTLTLSNGNLPDMLSHYMTEVVVDGPIWLERCSLWTLEGDRVRQSRDGRWAMEESGRELELTLAPPLGPGMDLLWRLNNVVVDGPRPAIEARRAAALTRAQAGDLPELPLAVALVAAPLAAAGRPG
ncbi:hypothetical protein L6R49_27685, partial [Myxococcota bacterium]|nr:hypothetical protein [Myxococcota bacterium]